MSRNLLEYPVEVDEVTDLLAEFFHQLSKTEGIGSLQSYIIDRVITLVKREFRHDDFNPC